MLPKCSLIIYICINAFDYNAIIVYFTVLKPGTLYETWYYPSYKNYDSVIIEGIYTYIYLVRLHSGNILNYVFKYVKRIKLIYGVLKPGSVLEPGTPPRSSNTNPNAKPITLTICYRQQHKYRSCISQYFVIAHGTRLEIVSKSTFVYNFIYNLCAVLYIQGKTFLWAYAMFYEHYIGIYSVLISPRLPVQGFEPFIKTDYYTCKLVKIERQLELTTYKSLDG